VAACKARPGPDRGAGRRPARAGIRGGLRRAELVDRNLEHYTRPAGGWSCGASATSSGSCSPTTAPPAPWTPGSWCAGASRGRCFAGCASGRIIPARLTTPGRLQDVRAPGRAGQGGQAHPADARRTVTGNLLLRDGKIAEVWIEWDVLSALRQMERSGGLSGRAGRRLRCCLRLEPPACIDAQSGRLRQGNRQRIDIPSHWVDARAWANGPTGTR
jgi:hypothetical protein